MSAPTVILLARNEREASRFKALHVPRCFRCTYIGSERSARGQRVEFVIALDGFKRNPQAKAIEESIRVGFVKSTGKAVWCPSTSSGIDFLRGYVSMVEKVRASGPLSEE